MSNVTVLTWFLAVFTVFWIKKKLQRVDKNYYFVIKLTCNFRSMYLQYITLSDHLNCLKKCSQKKERERKKILIVKPTDFPLRSESKKLKWSNCDLVYGTACFRLRRDRCYSHPIITTTAVSGRSSARPRACHLARKLNVAIRWNFCATASRGNRNTVQCTRRHDSGSVGGLRPDKLLYCAQWPLGENVRDRPLSRGANRLRRSQPFRVNDSNEPETVQPTKAYSCKSFFNYYFFFIKSVLRKIINNL